jgi:hypothetical protein
MAREAAEVPEVRTVRPPISTIEGGGVAAPKSSNAHHKTKGGEMPSPPDVILSLSPRMAKLVRFAVKEVVDVPEFMDFDEEEEFAHTWEAEDAVNALVAEIDVQLSGDRGESKPAPKRNFARSRSMPSDAELIAAKMAKAARKAVEE